ncbi:hypothetical protein FAES_3846 [Fibrella aestuarina BUZ 2]|uniref:Uncharacterized protein n=1 Tax=Fibrella aestuarina BUZ 2 TaxID=1166018 RepID=I0KCK0_9BACT|nr:hypothetical protein FAES_3846 [Fibrella aestuarina BUZ 2]
MTAKPNDAQLVTMPAFGAAGCLAGAAAALRVTRALVRVTVAAAATAAVANAVVGFATGFLFIVFVLDLIEGFVVLRCHNVDWFNYPLNPLTQ